jgi:thiol-disulfide isomerase/thioredoxin
MIKTIEVNRKKNINELNAMAREALDHPETHGLLVKIYAKWCGHCRNMAADWNKLIDELKANYTCKNPDCVLTIANVQIEALDDTDPVIRGIKHIPKDITGVPSIMYVSKGQRGQEYSGERVYDKLLEWVVAHPKFGLAKKHRSAADAHAPTHAPTHDDDDDDKRSTIKRITNHARTKFKLFHRKSLRRFHKSMKQKHQRSVKSRHPTPGRHTRQIPAYLRT